MAARATIQQEHSKQDTLRLLSAVEIIAKSTDLRFFCRYLLDLSGYGRSAFKVGTPDAVVFSLGRQSLGEELVVLLTEGNPQLYPELLLETTNERQSRRNDLNRADDFPDPTAGEY